MRRKYIVLDASLNNGDYQQVIIEADNFPPGSEAQDYFVREIKECKEHEVMIDDPNGVLSPGLFREEIY